MAREKTDMELIKHIMDAVESAETLQAAKEMVKYYILSFENERQQERRKALLREEAERRDNTGQESSGDLCVELSKLCKDVVKKMNHSPLALVTYGLAANALLVKLLRR